MVLSVLLRSESFASPHLWVLPVLSILVLLAWPLIAPAPKPTKPAIKRIVGALILAALLGTAAAVYAEDEAEGSVIARQQCRSKWLAEIFYICL